MNETLDQARARNIREALFEDIGTKDWTSLLVNAERKAHAKVVVREPAVLCGSEWFSGCLLALDPKAQIAWSHREGDFLDANTTVCTLTANARALLSAERPALNFLQTLSATATQTRQYVKAIEGESPNPKGCKILDTRKTLPGLRQAQKYAVRIGGGSNQRMALWDGILIKENHIAAAGGIAPALEAARSLQSGVEIQIEVENLGELQEALAAGAKNILLDNFNLHDMRQAVELVNQRAVLEASGGLSLADLKEVARTGVDRISIGRLTKDIHAIDYSLRITDSADLE